MVALLNLGYVAHHAGDEGRAATYFRESLRLARAEDCRFPIASALPGLAAVLTAQGGPRQAARLLGATDALLRTLPQPLDPADRASYTETEAALRSWLGDSAFAADYAAGQALSLDDALDEALRAAEGQTRPVA